MIVCDLILLLSVHLYEFQIVISFFQLFRLTIPQNLLFIFMQLFYFLEEISFARLKAFLALRFFHLCLVNYSHNLLLTLDKLAYVLKSNFLK